MNSKNFTAGKRLKRFVAAGVGCALCLYAAWPRTSLALQGPGPSQTRQVYLPVVTRADNKTAPIAPWEDGHGHDHSNLTWPPTPRGATDIVVRSEAEAQRQSQATGLARLNALDQKVRANPLVAAALGQRATRVAFINVEIDAKAKAAGEPSRLVYFNRETNTTVQVLLGPSEIILTSPADLYQPDLAEAEEQEAITIARRYFAAAGNSRVTALRGYTIMAYPPNQKGFYSTRMAYVSFHLDDDARPEFEAWVDLSNQRVTKAQGDQW